MPSRRARISARSSESVAASAVRPEFKSNIEVATRISAAADTIIDTASGGKFPGEWRGYDGAVGTTTTLMTFEEFEQLPDEAGKCELLEGKVLRIPPAKRKHMKTTERLYLLLREAVRDLLRRWPELRLGEVHMEMGYRMGSTPQSWLQPDVSITQAGQSGDDYYEGAPLVAIEVASDSQSAAHLEAKAQMYLSHGGREVWLIYPKTGHVWICRAGKTTVEQQENVICSEVLPGVEVRLEDIFQLE